MTDDQTPRRKRLTIAAALGDPAARDLLGPNAPPLSSFQSMLRGGDRGWRLAMRVLGHRPAALAACEIAQIAFHAYENLPDSPEEVADLARTVVEKLQAWRQNPDLPSAREEAIATASAFALAMDTCGSLYLQSGFRGHQLGRIVGFCYSVIAAPDNPRYVR